MSFIIDRPAWIVIAAGTDPDGIVRHAVRSSGV